MLSAMDNLRDWTICTLFQHFTTLLVAQKEAEDMRHAAVVRENDELRFNAQNRATEIGLVTVREATDRAERANEKRFDNVNEFRAAMKDKTNTYITRVEVEAMIAKNKQGEFSIISAVGVICGIIGGAIGHLTK